MLLVNTKCVFYLSSCFSYVLFFTSIKNYKIPVYIIVDRGFLTPLFMKTPSILLTPPHFSNFTQFTRALFVALLLVEYVTMPDLISYLMDLNGAYSTSTSLEYQQHLVCFMQQGIKFTEGLANMTWFLLVLWFHIIHRQTHTEKTWTNRLAHIYKQIWIPPVTCTQ